MKKKILAILLCASVMLTTACGKVEGTSDPTSGSSKESSSKSSNSSETSSEGESSAPESQTASEPESSTPETNSGFVHGKVNGNVYTSEFFGFKAEIANGFTFESDEDLAERNGLDDMSDENLNNGLNVNGVAFEMMALSEAVANVNIVVQNLDITSGGVMVSAEECVDLSLAAVKAQFKAMGIEDVEAEKSTASFLGSEVPCMNTKISVEGQNMVQKMIPIFNGKYLASITFTGVNEDEVLAIVNSFKAL